MTSKSKNKGLKLVVEECDASQRSIALASLCRTESSLGVKVIKFLKQKEISNFILIQIWYLKYFFKDTKIERFIAHITSAQTHKECLTIGLIL